MNNYIETPMMKILDKLVSLRYPGYTQYFIANKGHFTGDKAFHAIYNTLYAPEVDLFNENSNLTMYIIGHSMDDVEGTSFNGTYGTFVDFTIISKDMSHKDFFNAIWKNYYFYFDTEFDFDYFIIGVNNTSLLDKNNLSTADLAVKI